MLKKILKRIKNWLNPPLAMAPRFTDQVNETLIRIHNTFNREYTGVVADTQVVNDVQQERYEPTVLTNVAGTMIVNPGTHAQPQDSLPVTLAPGEMLVPHTLVQNLGIDAGAGLQNLYNQQTQGIGLLGQGQGQLHQQAAVSQQAQNYWTQAQHQFQWNPQVYYPVPDYQIPQQERAAPITLQTEPNWGHGAGQFNAPFEDGVMRVVPVAVVRKKRKLNLPDWF